MYALSPRSAWPRYPQMSSLSFEGLRYPQRIFPFFWALDFFWTGSEVNDDSLHISASWMNYSETDQFWILHPVNEKVSGRLFARQLRQDSSLRRAICEVCLPLDQATREQTEPRNAKELFDWTNVQPSAILVSDSLREITNSVRRTEA